MQIFIDGDGSPVKDDVIELAGQAGFLVTIVTSVDHYTEKKYPAFVSFVYVDKGLDSADFKIVGLIQKGDLLITQDYGLASLVLGKGVRVLHQTGLEFTQQNIENMLEARYYGAKVRQAGGRTKGPKPYSKEDRQHFRQALSNILLSEQ
ncbi:YaiI/YqxD family protein [Enterococcus sp. LJL90]